MTNVPTQYDPASENHRPVPIMGIQMEFISFQLTDLSKHQEEILKKLDELPDRYVPRREFHTRGDVVDKAFKAIENDLANFKRNMRANITLMFSVIGVITAIFAVLR